MAYVPPAKRSILASAGAGITNISSESSWAKSVKPQHKTISISSFDDFPTLGTKKPLIEHAKIGVKSDSMTLAQKLKLKQEEERRIEMEREEYEKELQRKTIEYEKEYAAIQARTLYKKLYRTNPSEISTNTTNENNEKYSDNIDYDCDMCEEVDSSFEE